MISPFDWKDRTLLVTGGTRGIGLHTALTFARAGARVVITWRWGGSEDSAREAFLSRGLPAPQILQADAGNPDDTTRLLSELRREHDRVDGLISNVALAARVQGPQDYKLRGLQRSIEYTAWPLAAYTTRIHELFGTWPSYVVGLSSFGTTRVGPGYDFVAASKAVLETLIRYLAWHLGPHGVHVNGVTCGMVRTESARDIGGPDTQAFVDWHERAIGPLPWVDPDAVARAIYALCSGWLDGVNGQILPIDDGSQTFAEGRFGLYLAARAAGLTHDSGGKT